MKKGFNYLASSGKTLEEIVDIYKKHRTQETAANELGISSRTLRKYLKQAGHEGRRGPIEGTQKKTKLHVNYGCLPNWLRTNPNVPLPKDISKISTITGCSIDSVKSYMKRRRQYLREEIQSLPDIRIKNIVLRSTKKSLIPSKAIKDYKISIENYTFRLVIKGELLSGNKIKVILPLRELKDLLQKE